MAKYTKTSKVHKLRSHYRLLVIEIAECDPYATCKLAFEFQTLTMKSKFDLFEFDRPTLVGVQPV
eukprot:6135830-Pleurochrysis_carterae.AAC.1